MIWTFMGKPDDARTRELESCRQQVEEANARTGMLAQRNVELAKVNLDLVRENIRLTQAAKPTLVMADDDGTVDYGSTSDADRVAASAARSKQNERYD